MARFALGLTTSLPIEKIVEYSKTAEQFYYDFAWVREQYTMPNSRDPYVLLTVIAANTESVFMGPWDPNPYFLHPSLLAVYTSSLSEYSRGRAVVSVGKGTTEALQKLGAIEKKPETTLKESFQILKRLLKGETVDYEGELFKAKSTKLFNKPSLTTCHGPKDLTIYVVGNSRESLRLAAEAADGVLVSVPIKYFPKVMGEIKTAADKAGRNLDGFDVANWLPWSISMDEKEARELVRPQVAEAVAEASQEAIEAVGLRSEEAERVRQALRADPGRAADLVTEEMINEFSVSGPYWECNKRVKELVKMGGWPDVRGRVQIVIGYPYGPGGAEAIKTIGEETVKIFRIPYDC